MCRCFKNIILFEILFAFGGSLHAQTPIHDTVFLKREIIRYDSNTINYSGIFIVKEKSSPYYKRVMDYDFKKVTSTGNFKPLGKIDPKAIEEIPKRWYRVSLYKGKYYIVDEDCIHKVLLTDTAYISNNMEGVYSEGLNSFRKIGRNIFQLNANTWYDYTFSLRIHIIDSAKELAVFEYFRPRDERHDYQLMVGIDKIKSYPLLVRFCKNYYLPAQKWYAVKPQIFMTDEPDYQALLNKVKQ